MTRLARRYAHPGATQQLIRIAGATYDLNFARLVFRCAMCHSELRRCNHGLVCTSDEGHRGFIHQRDVESIRARQAKNIETLNEFYTIENGKVVIKCQSSD